MYKAAGLGEPTIATWKLSIDFKSWVARIGTPTDRIAALESVFSELPSEVREYFQNRLRQVLCHRLGLDLKHRPRAFQRREAERKDAPPRRKRRSRVSRHTAAETAIGVRKTPPPARNIVIWAQPCCESAKCIGVSRFRYIAQPQLHDLSM